MSSNISQTSKIYTTMIHPISPREQEVLRLVAYERTSQEIANELFISNHTAISHRKNLMEKLHVKNTAGLVRRGFELGLLRVAVCMILCICLGYNVIHAQVLNGNVNYQVRTAGASWQADSDPFSAFIQSWDFGREELQFKVAACVDDNNISNFLAPDGREDYDNLMTTCGGSFLCYYENQDCPLACNFSYDDVLLNESNRSNGKYDLEWRSWEDDTACCFDDCDFGGEGNPTRDVLSSIRDVQDGDPNVWTTTITTQRSNTARYSWKWLWRYANGTKNSPLNFGIIAAGTTKTHFNSNRPTPVGAPTNLGYESDWEDVPSPDVTYTFEIEDIAKSVSFSNTTVGWAHRLILRKGNTAISNLSGQFGNSVTTLSLCPGISVSYTHLTLPTKRIV